jgi:hypothetical protein
MTTKLTKAEVCKEYDLPTTMTMDAIDDVLRDKSNDYHSHDKTIFYFSDGFGDFDDMYNPYDD